MRNIKAQKKNTNHVLFDKTATWYFFLDRYFYFTFILRFQDEPYSVMKWIFFITSGHVFYYYYLFLFIITTIFSFRTKHFMNEFVEFQCHGWYKMMILHILQLNWFLWLQYNVWMSWILIIQVNYVVRFWLIM